MHGSCIYQCNHYFVNVDYFSVKGAYEDDSFKNFKPTIHHFGSVSWVYGGPIGIICSLDLRSFPFDEQKCAIIFETWASDYDEVRICHSSPYIEQVKAFEHSEWNIKSNRTFVEDIIELYDFVPKHYKRLHFEIIFVRKPAYYFVNIITPLFFLNMLIFCGFWLPSESGERLSLSKYGY